MVYLCDERVEDIEPIADKFFVVRCDTYLNAAEEVAHGVVQVTLVMDVELFDSVCVGFAII